jgi:hypothetical protein
MPIKITPSESKAKCLLPTERVESTGMPDAPIMLQVAPPGFGKTEFAMSNPKCLLAACQQGHEGVDGYKVVVTSWDDKDREPEEINGIMHLSFMQLVKQVVSYSRTLPYNFIAIDTLDDLIKMLVDESMPRLRIKHLSDLGFGKGYDLGQNTPFRKAMNKLTKCGVGIMFITHEDISEKEFKPGEKRARKETTLPTGIYKQVFPILTSVLHGVFGKRRKGQARRDRIFVTEGSDQMLAKNRYGALPSAWIVPFDFEERWKQFVSFWESEENRQEAFEEFQKHYDLESL